MYFFKGLNGLWVLSLVFLPILILYPNSLHAADFLVRDYGELPNIRSVAIAPDGKHYAFVKRENNKDLFVILNAANNQVVGGVDASEVKPRAIYFVTSSHVILRATTTKKVFASDFKFERIASYIFNLKTKEMRPLMTHKNIWGGQGAGRVVGFNSDANEVYMPAYSKSRNAYNLFRVNLDTGKAVTYAKGNTDTIDWFVGKGGKVLAREEFANHRNQHIVKSYVSGKWVEIFKDNTDIRYLSPIAVSEDEKSLIVSKNNNDVWSLYAMSLESGQMTGPLYQEEKSDIEEVLTTGDLNRKIAGVLYSGLLPGYSYFDEEYQQLLGAIQAEFPMSAVHPVSATKDKSKIVLKISGNQGAEDYYLFDTKKVSLNFLASGYPQIEANQIAEMKAIRYTTRDGLSISAIQTWPVGVTNRKNLPMIVMPHGGPASYDSIRFNWKAQYFARKGYLVLQPNFRGSTGFGLNFQNSGDGKWGREMQDDVTDGVLSMIKSGYADPDRVCIVGASYGGYSALAGGAFSPELYKCVVSIAGVSDLPLMLKEERSDLGRDHWVISYWNRVMGKTQGLDLAEISPINFADKFEAPLLLLHGNDDTVVKIRQSEVMYKAMNRAGKPVEFVKLKGEDHWLSGSETRLALLEKVSEFLDKHNPVVH